MYIASYGRLTKYCNTQVSDIIGNVDYYPGPYKVTFLAGQKIASLNVTITDNTMLESNKTFILIINSSSLPDNINVGDPENITVTIMDDDGMMMIYNIL